MTNTALKSPSVPQFKEPPVTPQLALEHGIKADEYQHMLKILGRDPTFTELGIFSVMWSEHCSYKSSRLHLKKLPTSAPWVIQGPGENAGVIDIGDGQAAVFKMESHNHPSYIEPYQGAATGVGGIMRDVFTMGGRPIANMNALRFGDPLHPKTRQLVNGVVAGIAGYGNCMGVPTVGGETNFHARYNGNILVNAMTVGVVEQDKIYYSRGGGVGQPIVYVGSKTGRDGIHGATMSSAEFDDVSDAKRPAVQVGDPFVEKLLLEACLELMQSDAIICIQDMGAAGLTSSGVEIAAKGEIGVELDLDMVPQRELNMTPYEIMLSESQERMLMIVQPGKEEMARKIFEKWDLDFAVIGRTTADQRLKLNMYGKCWCDIPVPPLVDESPVYDRPQKARPKPAPLGVLNLDKDIMGSFKRLMACPDLSSKRWIWEQYDSLVRGETISSPGIQKTQAHKPADAAVVRLTDKKALAMTCDVSPRYCFADPYEGGEQAVAETWRNLTATGALPLAITDNLNFGNPEKPEIMWEFVTCLQGMAEACVTLQYPIISGNVSLYNETNGQGILPTPAIGGVGLIDHGNKSVGLGFTAEGESIILIGETKGHLGQSLYLREIMGREEGAPPPVDLAIEKRNGDFVRTLIQSNVINACHDLSDGGLLVGLAEMVMASGIGADISASGDAAFWYGEDQARYLVTSGTPDKVLEWAEKSGVSATLIGKTAGLSLRIPENQAITISEIREIHEHWLPAYMEGRA